MRWLRLVLAAVLLLACGGDEATGDIRDVRGTPSKTEGGEAGEAASWAPTAHARAMRDDDLVVRVVGAASSGRGPIRLELRNRSSDPVRVAPAWLQVSVFQRGLLVRGCGNRTPRELEGVESIGAGQSAFTAVSLPCALDQPGRYTVLVVLLTPAPLPGAARAPTDARVSGFGDIVVDRTASATPSRTPASE